MNCNQINNWLDHAPLSELRNTEMHPEIHTHLRSCSACRRKVLATIVLRELENPKTAQPAHDLWSQFQTHEIHQKSHLSPSRRLTAGLVIGLCAGLILIFLLLPRKNGYHPDYFSRQGIELPENDHQTLGDDSSMKALNYIYNLAR